MLSLIIVLIIVILLAFEWHFRQRESLFYSNQFLHPCKASKPCKSCKKCIQKLNEAELKLPVRPIKKPLESIKKQILDEIKAQNKLEQNSTQKLPENTKKVYEIPDVKIDDAIMNSHYYKDDHLEQKARNLRDSINMLYAEYIEPGDDRLYQKMQHLGKKDKNAINYRAKFDKSSLSPWVSEELDSAENSIWWENNENYIA